MNGAARSTKRRAIERWRDESALRRLADDLLDGAEDRMPAIVPHLDPDPIAKA
jgi:hypothetical protein